MGGNERKKAFKSLELRFQGSDPGEPDMAVLMLW